MYGGMWREYNPGCFVNGLTTYQELQKRLDGTEIDVYAIDNAVTTDQLIKENRFNLFEIMFFSKRSQLALLDHTLASYDALVIGGDIVWGGDDVVEDNDVFFLNSEKFLQSTSPVVLINCVHSFYEDVLIERVRKKLVNACNRSDYVAVRTPALQQRLEKLGIDKKIYYVPDPVLNFNTSEFEDFNMNEYCVLNKTKRKIGISVRARLKEDLIKALEQIDLGAYEVVIYPFSRQYWDLETVIAIKAKFGDKFKYIEEYFDPIRSFKITKHFDVIITDKMHGITAAVIHGVQFISLDIEHESTSRKDQHVESLGIGKERNIRLTYGNPENANILASKLPELLSSNMSDYGEQLSKARNQIRAHFDTMAKIIRY